MYYKLKHGLCLRGPHFNKSLTHVVQAGTVTGSRHVGTDNPSLCARQLGKVYMLVFHCTSTFRCYVVLRTCNMWLYSCHMHTGGKSLCRLGGSNHQAGTMCWVAPGRTTRFVAARDQLGGQAGDGQAIQQARARRARERKVEVRAVSPWTV